MWNAPAPEPKLLDREESVLLVIDAQERLLPAIAERSKILDNIVRLVKFAQIIDLPILFSEQQKLGKTVEEIHSVVPGLDPIEKVAFDCFESPEFNRRLERLRRRCLVVTGVEAHICVAQTAISGLGKYTVHAVSDAMSSRSPHNRDVALARMGQHGVVITSTEMFIYELLGKAGTDEFKGVLPLVK